MRMIIKYEEMSQISANGHSLCHRLLPFSTIPTQKTDMSIRAVHKLVQVGSCLTHNQLDQIEWRSFRSTIDQLGV